ncbi:DALR anticodon-binding domain-containing protein [Streptomyces sp. ODS28]|uniref:DALR anticodon-binding domain-containing protein n=1 Tax=Streptomyces sp. ODS28 TaxID=3136688 RepID=UPI0031E7C364
MTPAQLSRTVLLTMRRAVEDGELCVAEGADLPQDATAVTVESPPRRGRGDYAVSIAFRLARAVGRPPGEIAELLRTRLEREPGVARVEVAGGGFLNITLDDAARADLVRELAAEDPGCCPDDPANDIAQWAAATGDDPEKLKVRKATVNPLFRVQYAHARTRALLRNGGDLGVVAEACGTDNAASERALLALLADHGRFCGAEAAAQARHLEAVADAFFDFHDSCPPLPRGGQKPGAAHRSRLALAEATGAVLAGGLTRLGVTAPAHL